MSQCIICDKRPAQRGEAFCHIHQAAIDAERKLQRPGNWWSVAFRFATWRGQGVAFMPNGKKGIYVPKALPPCALKRLPKDKTICLDSYVEGLSRAQVKAIKRAIIQANNFA